MAQSLKSFVPIKSKIVQGAFDMPDLLKMDKLVQTLEKTAATMDSLAEKLAASVDKMTESLAKTQDTIDRMAKSVDNLSQKTGNAMENMNVKFDKLIETLVQLGKDSPLINPKSVMTATRDMVSDFLKR